MKRGAIVATLLVTPMLILSAWALFLPSESPIEPQYGTILAEPYYSGVERTWNAGSAGLASVPANWNPVGVPANGDNITFDGTSVYDCTWNVEETLGDFTIDTGYTGIITQTASFECADWYYNPANINCFVPDITYPITIEGDAYFLKSEATRAYNLVMSGSDNTLTAYLGGFGRLTISGTIEIVSPLSLILTSGVSYGGLYVTETGIFNMESGLELGVALYWGGVYSNLGEINGDGSLTLRLYSESKTDFLIGDIEVDLTITQISGSGGSRSLSLGDNLDTGSTNSFTIQCQDAGQLLTFNSGTYTVDTGNMIVGDRAIFTQGTGTCTFGEYLQDGYGSVFNQGGNVSVTGDFEITDGTFNGNRNYDLICSGNYTESDDGIVTDGLLNLVMDGDTKVITSIMPWEDYYHSVTIDGDIEITHTVLSDIFVKNLTVTVGNTLTIDYPKIINMLSNGTYSNLGTVTGYYILFWCNEVDRTITLGTITDCDVEFAIDDADADRTVYLGENTVIGGNGRLIMDSDDLLHTITLHHNSDYTLTVNGNFANILDRSILIQGTGTWTFYDYSQSGTDAIFYQGGLLTIGVMDIDKGQFISNGDAITVTDDWSSKGFIHGNGVVYLTSADANINMDSGDSFYNVTVSGNYIMNTDTNVDLRATITGTVTGTGDFIEPLPVFTRIIVPAACPLRLYESPIEQQYWDAVSLETAPYWMYLEDDVLKGIPGENDTGSFAVSVSLTWNDMVVYQNITLIVCADVLTNVQITMLGVALSLALGLGLVCVGYIWDIPFLIAFSGFIWLFASVTVYKEISVGWTVIALGLGVILLGAGGFQLVEESEY